MRRLNIVGWVTILTLWVGEPFCALPANQQYSLAPMLNTVTPAVVNISTEGSVELRLNPLFNDPFFRRFFNVPERSLQKRTQSLGSGVIVDSKKGLILTNYHVIKSADEIRVKLLDGGTFKADLVGFDPETDIAVLKIGGGKLVSIELSDSDSLKVGDFVVAIGNPFGLGQTVTSGIVSALARSGLGILDYEDLIQTDASINPGNSGGALVNLEGGLIGINTAIYSQHGGNIGIGFAIPVNMARDVLNQIVQYGEVRRGFVGAKFQDLDPSLIEAFGLSVKKGAVIVSVLGGSPADTSGLELGDVVIEIDGRPISSASDARNRFGLARAGQQLSLDCLRNGKSVTVELVVGDYKDALGTSQFKESALSGLSVGPIPETSENFGRIEGVMFYKVKKGSKGWLAGLRERDVVSSINRQKIKTVEEFLDIAKDSGSKILLRVHRGGGNAYVLVE